MFNLWDKTKVVIYFEDEEAEGFASQTVTNVKEEATEEELVQFTSAVDSLSELPMAHFLVTSTHRYVV